MEYLVRFVQHHESFRKEEIKALAVLADINIEWIYYSEVSPFSVIRIHRTTSTIDSSSESLARLLISRSILTKSIYELWGTGADYSSLHASIQSTSSHLWPLYRTVSFKFTFDTYNSTRPEAQRSAIINTFRYLGFQGPVQMKCPDAEFCIFEEYESQELLKPKICPVSTTDTTASSLLLPLQRLLFGRFVALSARQLVDAHDLKKRQYISTTSMDAELSLVTANLALAGPGKLFFDPFVGTGSFLVAAAQFGSYVLGADIDGRSFRGVQDQGKPMGRGKMAKREREKRRQGEMGVKVNLEQYGLGGQFLDCFTSDLTNSPLLLKRGGWLDGIICDPPYGVREGLKVLGLRSAGGMEEVLIDGVPAHTLDGYVAPKRPYSFLAMLDDILEFAASTLVEEGRLGMWMPTANEEDEVIEVPRHQALELVCQCVQPFNNWSRRLLTYRRRRWEDDVVVAMERQSEVEDVNGKSRPTPNGLSADALNPFRKRYFQGFQGGPEAVGDIGIAGTQQAVPDSPSIEQTSPP